MTAGSDAMLIFVLNCITPLLIAGGITDPDAARIAAQQAIEAYAGAPLVTGPIVAFALASLDSLRLSAQPDISTSMRLKLRGNANALNQTSSRLAATTPAAEPNHPADTIESPETEAWPPSNRRKPCCAEPNPRPTPTVNTNSPGPAR